MADYVTTEPMFDFERGDFVIVNGRIRPTVGKDRVKGYISKVLRTPRGRYAIYDGTDYGTRIKELLVGKTYPRDYMLSEIKREIMETLLKSDDITSVDEFDVEQNGTRVKITFMVSTEYGTLETEEVL